MLHLILGGCGTGKSTILMDAVREAVAAGKKAAVLVPEQFSFENEKKLHQALGTQTFNRVETYSFMTLSDVILLQAQSARAGSYASEQEKLIYLWQSAQECAERNELVFLGKRAASAEFLADLTELVTKLRKAGVSGEQLIETSEHLQERLACKVGDLGRLLLAYDRILRERGRNDDLVNLTEAAMLASQNAFFEERCFFIDEFDSFTADQYRMLQEMIARCPSVTCTLRADDPAKRPTGIFVGGNKTGMELTRIARELSIEVKTTYLREYRRSIHPDLKAPVDQIFRRHAGMTPWEGHLRVMRAADPEEEVSFICSQICALLTSGEGIRCRDIAVAVKNPAVYLPRLKRAMKRYDLPFDTTEKRPLLYTDLVRHVLTILELIAGRQWNTELLLRYVKSPFSGYSPEKAAMLEQFCFYWGIEHEDWEKPFYTGEDADTQKGFDTFDRKRMEKLRAELLAELTALRDACAGAGVRGICTALCKHLEAKHRAYKKELRRMDEITQNDFVMVWNLLSDCLDTLVTGHGDAVLPMKQIYEQMLLLLKTSSFSVPPQTLDSIHIVDARTSRLNTPKIVFVPGVLEGEFPGDIRLSGLFTEQELSVLDSENICIARLLPELHSDELMIVVRTLASASEQLWLTYPALDADGGTCIPSPVLDELEGMFRETITEYTSDLPVSFFVRTLESAYDTYVRRIREDTPEIAALREVLSGYPEYAVRLERLSETPPEPELSPETMQGLLGDRILLSPSGIETFHQCAFKYYCEYLLRLYVPERMSYSSQNIGNLTHYCLEQILREVDMDAFLAMDKAALRTLIDGYSDRYSRENFSDAMLRSGRFRINYRSTGATLIELLQCMQQSFRQEQFRPVGCEVGVREHPAEGEFPALSLDGGRILCAGKIDRIDVCDTPQGKLLRVVDYKTGDKSLVPAKLAYGLDMQMLLYLFALRQSGAYGNAAPAGVLYLPAGQVSSSGYEERTAELRQRDEILGDYYLSRGLVTEDAADRMEPRVREQAASVLDGMDSSLYLVTNDQMQGLRAHVERKVTEMGRSLRAGIITPEPCRFEGADPCKYCKFADLCGSRRTGDAQRFTKKLAAESAAAVFLSHGKEDEEDA